MSLDLSQTALQIDRMAGDLDARQSDRRQRLLTAIEAIHSFDVSHIEAKRRRSAETVAWPVPVVSESPGTGQAPPPLPSDFCVVAVDGSHIDVDRHMPARCFLINIGLSILTYGSAPDARLYSLPRLYAQDHELVIRDKHATNREQAVEGAVLGAKRAVEEVKALAEAVRELPRDLPTLALMDGSLVMMGLRDHGYRDFVLRELIEEGFVPALDDLRQAASERVLAVASYVSLPRSAEIINSLRLTICPYHAADCALHCGTVRAGERPCDAGAQSLMDRDVFGEVLRPGERSGMFSSTSSLVSGHYQGHAVSFFYLHAGEEIGRVEVPSWIVEDEAMLGLVHSLIIEQCRLGPGYPTALIEAHEQAAVTVSDRRFFVQQVEDALSGRGVPVFTSEKNRSKRLRWL